MSGCLLLGGCLSWKVDYEKSVEKKIYTHQKGSASRH